MHGCRASCGANKDVLAWITRVLPCWHQHSPKSFVTEKVALILEKPGDCEATSKLSDDSSYCVIVVMLWLRISDFRCSRAKSYFNVRSLQGSLKKQNADFVHAGRPWREASRRWGDLKRSPETDDTLFLQCLVSRSLRVTWMLNILWYRVLHIQVCFEYRGQLKVEEYLTLPLLSCSFSLLRTSNQMCGNFLWHFWLSCVRINMSGTNHLIQSHVNTPSYHPIINNIWKSLSPVPGFVLDRLLFQWNN